MRDAAGSEKYSIDSQRCIHCGLCEKACPNNNPVKKNTPLAVYAAYAKDADSFQKSASGGAASEFYRNAIKKDYSFYGAKFNRCNSLEIVKGVSEKDIEVFRGSKYVKSSMLGCYSSIRADIQSGKTVLFVGLPCQAAAIRRYIGESENRLITVDLVCHGAPPQVYLKDYLEHYISKYGQYDALRFRETGQFIFGSMKEDRYLYRKPSYKDFYMYSFLKGIIYSDNCYHCSYACSDRVSDLTICDFWGIERAAFNKDKVSAVLVNTERGKAFWEGCKNAFYYEECSLEEVIKTNAQLKHPSIEHPYRQRFLALYTTGHSFMRAIVQTRVTFDIMKYYLKDFLLGVKARWKHA